MRCAALMFGSLFEDGGRICGPRGGRPGGSVGGTVLARQREQDDLVTGIVVEVVEKAQPPTVRQTSEGDGRFLVRVRGDRVQSVRTTGETW